MRNIKIAPGEYYHIYNRGMSKQNIFLDDSDRVRFLFCLLYFQSDYTFNNLSFYTNYFKKHKKFNLSKRTLSDIVLNRSVGLVNFTLMPNHFHMTVLEVKEKGIATYMQRVLNAYTKYFNTKYKKSGHLLQGPYQAVHVEDNEQLLYLSAYIHKNPKEIVGEKWQKYFWSSYQDCVLKNRWPGVLVNSIIIEQFDSKNTYSDFVKKSTAKDSSDNK